MSIQRVLVITFFAHFINDGLIMTLPLLIPFMARDFNLSYTQIGILGGSFMLTMGIGQFFSGYLSDLSQKKWPFLSFGLVLTSLSLFAMSFSSSYAHLLCFNLLAGLGASFYHPCGVALLAKCMGKIKGKILGIHGAGGCVGILVYPAIAGILLSTEGWGHVLFVLGPTALIAAALFLFTNEEPVLRERNTFPLVHTDSITLIVLFGCIAMFFRGFITFFPVQLEEMGYSAVSVATAVTIFYGTGVVGETAAGFLSDKYSKRWIVATSLAAASVLVLILFQEVWILIVPLGFVAYVVWVPVLAVYVEGVPEAWYGTALGVFQGISGLMAFLSPIAMGVVAERTGVSSSFAVLSFVGIAGALLSLRMQKKSKR